MTSVNLLLSNGLWSIKHWEEDLAECELVWTTDLAHKGRIIRSRITLCSEAAGNIEQFDSDETPDLDYAPDTGAPTWVWRGVGIGTKGYGESLVVTLDFVLRHPHPSAAASHHSMASWVPGVIDSKEYFDVTFNFANGRDLHSNSTFLSIASPYYKTLFSSGFSETSLPRTKTMTPSTKTRGVLNAKRPRPSEDDSDAEADLLPLSPPSSSYRVEINETSYVTYREVLRWIHTREISFAPLKSAHPTDVSEPKKTQRSNPAATIIIPASPKSVYRLADFLELPELQKLALASIVDQVKIPNVVHELLSEVCALYDPIQEALLKYAAEHWDCVKKSEGWKAFESKIEEGEDEVGAHAKIMMRLMRMLPKATRKLP
ncbi:hypothetical protein P7C70_g5261, partial [Phenoliferia sp. Uapishka_3]